jgi:uncharacterized protein
MEWIAYVGLVLAMVLCLVLALMQLPGLWIMLAAAVGYAWLTHWVFIGPGTLIILGLIALAAEGIETLASAGGARRAGATKTAMGLSILGALVGGVLFTFIPIPIVGTLIGVCLGAFAGAMTGEIIRGRTTEQGARVGIAAALGRLLGTLAKLTLGLAMFLVAALSAIPTHPLSQPSPMVPATTQPAPIEPPPLATNPATLPIER